MKYISHRGNTLGPDPSLENSPDYIDLAASEGFYVEIDVHWVGGQPWLGHDEPQYLVDMDWLFKRWSCLFIHAKDPAALSVLQNSPLLHSFWHENDQYTLTSKHDIWCYPGVFVPKGAIQCGPSIALPADISKNASGICSDFVAKLRYE